MEIVKLNWMNIGERNNLHTLIYKRRKDKYINENDIRDVRFH